MAVPDDVPLWLEEMFATKLDAALEELVKTSNLSAIGKIAVLREMAAELDLRAIEQREALKDRAEALLGRSNN